MSLLARINPIARRGKYNIPLWQYPPFIFFLIGIIIIGAILFSYFVGTKYFEPITLTLAILAVTAVLFVLDYIIVRSFERLAEANLMKSEFVSIASHQLRAPLSNIKWTLNLAESENNLNGKQKYFRIIKESNDRMLKLVNEMLDVSQIEEGKWILNKQEAALEEIIKKVAEEFSIFARGNNIKIEVNIEKNLPKVFIDAQKIIQALSNLLANAIRYTKEGGIVKIKASKKNKKVWCEIKDNGVGIPKEEQKYIFQKFFRCRNVLKHQTKGTGLGLFIAKNIINDSGGKIGFKSKEGAGTTFWFELPVAHE